MRKSQHKPPSQPEQQTAQTEAALTLDPRCLARPGLLELMRAAAGLSYGDIAKRTGFPRAKVIRLIRGAYEKPRKSDVNAIREVLWERIPALGGSAISGKAPAFLTLDEAAELLALSRVEIRRLIARHKAIGAIKLGRHIRIPRASMTEFFFFPSPKEGRKEGLTRQQLATLFRVEVGVIRYANRQGQIRYMQRGWHGRVLIPAREVKRVLRQGTEELRPRRSDLSHADRKKGR